MPARATVLRQRHGFTTYRLRQIALRRIASRQTSSSPTGLILIDISQSAMIKMLSVHIKLNKFTLQIQTGQKIGQYGTNSHPILQVFSARICTIRFMQACF
jgi:hypothetical protein